MTVTAPPRLARRTSSRGPPDLDRSRQGGLCRACKPLLEVLHEPELLASPRYIADHTAPVTRTPEQEARWRSLLARAEILYDFDRSSGAELPARAPNLRWIQATSAGIGEYVRKMGYGESMPETVFTTASGVHARPLAEFLAMVEHDGEIVPRFRLLMGGRA